ncbi:MAG: hypothetical protein AAFP79_04560 [Pseudomonadota bacterium]
MCFLRYCGFLFAVALTALTVPLHAQVKAVKLNPISDWIVERDRDTCTISRRFGDSDQPTTLTLRNRDPWNGGFHVGITSQKYALTGQPPFAGWLPNGRFVEGREARVLKRATEAPTLLFRHGPWNGKMPKKGTPEHNEYWAKDEDGRIIGARRFKRNLQSFFVRGAYERPLLLATGPLDNVIELRDQCIDEVLVAMGVDPKDEDRDDHIVEMKNAQGLGRYLARKAPADIHVPGDWGFTSFLVYLDAELAITSCRLSTLPFDAEYEASGCYELRKRAKFRFKDGEVPRPSFYKLAFFLTEMRRSN